MNDPKDPKNFKPGIYSHYKRPGNYIALHLASHHDTDELFVVYVCGETGRVRMREWATEGKDSWTDFMHNGYVPSKLEALTDRLAHLMERSFIKQDVRRRVAAFGQAKATLLAT